MIASADPIARRPSRLAGTPSPIEPIEPFSFVTSAMGGRLAVHLDPAGDGAAEGAAIRTVARIRRWADRLSRHIATSELSALNGDPRSEVTVRPTLGAVLRAAHEAAAMSEGFVDITLLDARLAAEDCAAEDPAGEDFAADDRATRFGAADGNPARSWTVAGGRRGIVRVTRLPGVRFDLGGVAKGWIADRALAMLASWPSAVVDADGDLAVRVAPGRSWKIGVDDPRAAGALLAVLELSVPAGSWPGRWGVATSGTSVHRWTVAGGVRHHLIDPRTGNPAVTDVVQATVICGSALRAEALAKAAVIAGSIDGLALLERAGVAGAVILTERDEVLAPPSTLDLLTTDRAA